MLSAASAADGCDPHSIIQHMLAQHSTTPLTWQPHLAWLLAPC
jgi:hypothetical protein